MMLDEDITQGSIPQAGTQSVTHEKENTKQSNANSVSQYAVSTWKVRISLMYSKK